MTGPEQNDTCSGIKLYLDCCGVELAGEIDRSQLMRRIGEAMRTGDVLKIRICVDGKLVDAWIKPSNSSISYIGDPDVRVA